MDRKRINFILWAVLALPLPNPSAWHALLFSKIPPNKVSFSASGLKIEVNRSSSPIFYLFDKTETVTAVQAAGVLSGLPNLPPGSTEGVGKADDFALRIGFVIPGGRKISLVEKWFAPQWLKQLSDLEPHQKFGKVYFLNIAQTLPVGFKRQHPSSKYLEEEVVLERKTPGPFSFDHAFSQPLDTFGLWIQCDGDDTKSSFDVELTSLKLVTR